MDGRANPATIGAMNQSRMPHRRPSAPSAILPAGACDAHFHMFGDPAEFPLWEGRSESPAPGTLDDWVERVKTHLETLGFARGVLIQSLMYGNDNSVTTAALKRLGRKNFRAVGLVPADADGATLDALKAEGYAGIRLNYDRWGIFAFDAVAGLADRLAERDMHIQMLLQAPQHMAAAGQLIRRLPVPVVIDHIAQPDIAAGIDAPGFALLRQLVAEGLVHVKLSALFRSAESPYTDADPFVAALVAANPERCLWGSDWPHIMLGERPMPDAGHLLDAFLRVVPDPPARQQILVANPARLYGFA
ncbi:amidohydrolase family protein [Acuticoccus sp. MNP-M23]|uniref:amidohydrolase family protein n=1 Tax=Acuticoccus sp. MNP-M23 TaxID=3072793 RepID=UPI002814DED9|nr:amidohydrolase family protein [Acuticoccus sp. MNP-M23]WMS43971.1 amidohydrolase family protein [Acuticoccus sp. MNP-M23]